MEEAAISSAEVATARDELVIWLAIWRRFFTICRIECSSQPISSRDWLLMSVVRSPLETSSQRMPSWVSGSAISRDEPQREGNAEEDGDPQDDQDEEPGVVEHLVHDLRAVLALGDRGGEPLETLEGLPSHEPGQQQHHREAAEDLAADGPVFDALLEAA